MQHQDRTQLISEINGVVKDLYGASVPSEQGASAEQGDSAQAWREDELARRLNRLLDAFLLESQPRVEAYATVLIADIRGFTALMASMPMETMITVLQRWFSTMTEIIERFGGVVDKFVGDAVMALFGLPEPRGDDSARALACAAEMQHAMLALNQENHAEGMPRIYAGIAVNTGDLVAGSFGAPTHSEYTVIGDVVNLASRMESFALRGQVLISETSRIAAADLIEVGAVNEVRFKGIPYPVRLYDLQAVLKPNRVEVPKVEVRRAPRIPVKMTATFRQIEANQIRPGQIPGLIRNLGYYGLSADLPLGLPDASDVVINLAPQHGAQPVGDVYARVLRSVARGGRFRTSLELTSMETPAHQRLKELIDESLWRH